MTKYHMIAEAIREKIISGTYMEGSILPKQEDLSKEFDTSRITVRKALQLLIEEGLIYTKRGSGSFVRNNVSRLRNGVTNIDSVFGTTQQESGKKVTSKILKFEVRFPKEHEKEALLLKESDPVYEIHRVRFADKKAVSIEYTVMPFKIMDGLNKEVIEGSIYDYVRNSLGLAISAAERVIIASKANELDSLEFGIEIGEPVLELIQTVFLDDGTPFDFSKTRYPYTSGKIFADIN